MFLLKYKNFNYHNADDYYIKCSLKDGFENHCILINPNIILRIFNKLKRIYKKIIKQPIWDIGWTVREELEV